MRNLTTLNVPPPKGCRKGTGGKWLKHIDGESWVVSHHFVFCHYCPDCWEVLCQSRNGVGTRRGGPRRGRTPPPVDADVVGDAVLLEEGVSIAVHVRVEADVPVPSSRTLPPELTARVYLACVFLGTYQLLPQHLGMPLERFGGENEPWYHTLWL